MIKLFDYALSGNCYKVRLLLELLGLDYQRQPIDFYPGFEHRKDDFLEVNPLGQLPVLEDDDMVIRDAQAILVHLASNYDRSGQWYPLKEPRRLGQIQIWLAFADSITATISAARLHHAMFFEIDVEKATAGGIRLMRILDEHLWYQELRDQAWLCAGASPTIADIACFPYVALSEEAGIELHEWPAIQRWLERFMRIDGFAPMAGMKPLPIADGTLS
jgi:glutathione S-transferase